MQICAVAAAPVAALGPWERREVPGKMMMGVERKVKLARDHCVCSHGLAWGEKVVWLASSPSTRRL